MKKDYRLYLDDIIHAITNIERYTSDLSPEEFLKHRMAIDAVIRNFEIIGEATKYIPVSFRRKHPDIPWTRMAGMRNRLTMSISVSMTKYYGQQQKMTCQH